MGLITRLALVISVMGTLSTWIFIEPLQSLGLQIWAAFITWGCFYHCGGGATGLKQAVFGGLWGGVMVTVALALIPALGGGSAVTALCVGLTVAIFILGANLPLLSVIPAAVYGYSAVAAFALLLPGTDIYSSSIAHNPLMNIGLSMIIGGVLGYISEILVQAIGPNETASAQ